MADDGVKAPPLKRPRKLGELERRLLHSLDANRAQQAAHPPLPSVVCAPPLPATATPVSAPPTAVLPRPLPTRSFYSDSCAVVDDWLRRLSLRARRARRAPFADSFACQADAFAYGDKAAAEVRARASEAQ